MLFKFRDPFGFPLVIQRSTVMLAVVIVGIFAFMRNDPVGGGVVLAILLISIYVHELGHAFACRFRGVKVHEVAIHGGGGYCRHDRSAPFDEVIIVAAGPLANLAFAAIAFGAERAFRAAGLGAADLETALPWFQAAGHAGFLAKVNLILCLLNLLPVLPLDGGRLLLLGLWRTLPYERALRLTGLVGVVVSVLWLPAAFLLFISFGFILLFTPSVRRNWRLWKGEAR